MRMAAKCRFVLSELQILRLSELLMGNSVLVNIYGVSGEKPGDIRMWIATS